MLAQPAAASAAERNKSVYGQIITPARSRLSHTTADKLVYCHEALHLQERMQDAGWEADICPWDSDEESGNSSDDDEGDDVMMCLVRRVSWH